MAENLNEGLIVKFAFSFRHTLILCYKIRNVKGVIRNSVFMTTAAAAEQIQYGLISPEFRVNS